MSDRITLSIEEIQRHEPWLTALVRQLVAPSDVEDVLQDTWLAAVEQPPKRRQAWRRWLATVARNTAVTRWHTRRRQRESEGHAARREEMPSTQETVERLATLEKLLGVVRELPEPYRTAVLLRHYHGLAVGELATELGITESAARQRVKRGLDDVRRRLRERDGAAWQKRLTAVLPWCVPTAGATSAAPAAAATTTVLGVLAMNMKIVVLLGAAGVLAGGVVLVAVLRPPATLPVAGPADSRPESGAMAADAAAPAARHAVAPASAVDDVAPPTRSGRVIDTRGAPVVGARLLGADGEALAATDASGAFTHAQTAPDQKLRIEPRFCVVRGREYTHDGEVADELLFVVAPSVVVRGVVALRDGTPLPDVDVTVEVLPLLDFPEPLEGTRPAGVRGATTGSSGAFAVERLPGGICRLRFRSAGYRSTVHEVTERGEQDLRIVMDPAEGGRWQLTGRVVDAADWLVPDAVVGLGRDTVRSDAYGRYAFELTQEQVERDPQSLYAAKPGYQTLVLDAPGVDAFGAERSLERDLRLPGPALSIRGTVRGGDGAPLADAVVALWRVERMPDAEFAESLAVPEDIEDHRWGIAPRRVFATTAADGTFELGGLRDREYRLRVLHSEHLALTSAPLRAGSSGVELRYPPDNLRTVQCRIVSLQREPMPGLRVLTSMQVHDTSSTSSWDRVDDLRTDATGAVELPRVMRSEPTQVIVRGPDIITATHEIAPDAGDSCEIVVARRCHFRVECSDPRWATADVEIETAAGAAVWISSSRGVYNQVMSLEGGRSPVMTTSELAATMVVDGEKRVPIALVPGEVTVVRF